jgi:hypothetical protein
MNLPGIVVVLLALTWVASFVCFVVAGFKAYASGTTFEYMLYGVQFPYVAAALLGCMAASSGLLWANYRGESYRQSEQLIYGSLFGLSVFGFMLSGLLALLA